MSIDKWKNMDGQMSIFDLDSWCGKTSTVPSVQITEKTSERSWKRPQELKIKMPIFLDLRKADGRTQELSLEMGILSHGVGTMLADGEFHSAESAYVYSLTSTEMRRQGYCLKVNCGESPMTERLSKLSQILEPNPDPKYNLSARACQGILNRAAKRGKELPTILKEALERQAGGALSFQERAGKPGGGKGLLIAEERTNTLSTQNNQSVCLNPWDVQSKHIQPQDGVAEALYSGECRGGGGESYVMQEPILLESNQNHATIQTEGISTALPAAMGEGGGYVPMICLNDQGGSVMNTSKDVTCALRAEEHGHQPIVAGFSTEHSAKSRSIGYEEQCSPTLRAGVVPATVYGISGYDSNAMKSDNPHSGIYQADTSRTLDLNGGNPACNQGGMAVVCIEGNGARESHQGDGYKESETMYTLNTVEQHGVCYGIDRASFNQGQNAQYNFSVEEEIAQTIVAKGPGGVMQTQ